MTRRRSGFTLIETVVTVGLIAVLAAFVVPSVMKKADAADPVKVANDLNSISTAIQQFATDVKGALPGDLEDLTEPLLTNSTCNNFQPCDSTVTHAEIYTIRQVEQWKGPYLAASVMNSPTAAIRSGYVAEINTTLLRFDAISGVPELCPSVGTAQVPCAGFIPTNPLFVSVRVDSLTLGQAGIVNDMIDGPNETQPGLQGRFRYPTPATPTKLATPAYYLATPIP
jgi:prepilin-type N-terminal cleavage/methylation domain-containing protein